MGCRCCRMIKSYIYDPTVPVDAHGYKQDPSTNSLVPPYQCHRLPDEMNHKKQGFHNLAYTSNSSPTKSDIDNNHINQLHVNNQSRSIQPQPKGIDSSLYILQPEGGPAPGPTSPTLPSAPPISSLQMLGTEPSKRAERFRDSGLGNGGMPEGSNGSDGCLCGQEEEEEEEEGRVQGWRPADEESVISVDIHTSSTSLSSADTKLAEEDREVRSPVESPEKEAEDSVSVTESMVAEALAALEAATAGEEDE